MDGIEGMATEGTLQMEGADTDVAGRRALSLIPGSGSHRSSTSGQEGPPKIPRGSSQRGCQEV